MQAISVGRIVRYVLPNGEERPAIVTAALAAGGYQYVVEGAIRRPAGTAPVDR